MRSGTGAKLVSFVLGIGLLTASLGFCMDPVIVLSASSTEGPGFEVTRILDGDGGTRWSSLFADDQ